ncbi:MAG: hypothetical protein EBT20_20095 [Alphaproteobacteria bacterium]|nr:hypothetical protein [Alphaproteobacteria bacterium]
MVPEAVKSSGREYRSEMDTVAGFLNDECFMETTSRVGVGTLYEQYASWCNAQGKQPRTIIQFGKALTSQGYEKKRDSSGWYWVGLTTYSI